MEVIPNSYIARVVLAYLYEEKLNKAAIEFCMASPYLKEERDFVKRGFRPATCISLKLTALFREYGEIQQKLDSFVEKYDVEFDVQPDLPLVRKIDVILSLLKQVRHRRRHSGEEKVVVKKEPRKSAGSCKRKRGAPSPHPSLSSSTPEVGEPKQKRVCTNPAFIVLNDSGKNLSNLSNISPIGGEGDSSQDSDREDEVEEEVPEKEQEEEEPLDVRKFPSIDLFSQTLLENENYSEKIADLINKGLESSMSTQPDAKEGTSAIREEPVEAETVESESKADCQSFNFNFDELISNIVNNAVKDPVFDDMMDDISSKAIKTQNGNEVEESETVPPPETPLKERLRKTCRKNYNPCAVKRSVKQVRVISDEPYYGGFPEGVDVENSQPATMAVVKVESFASTSADLDQSQDSIADPPETVAVQPEVTSTADPPATAAATTQFYVIQPDNTTKLVDINQLQFPTQQSGLLTDPTATESGSTLIPITGVGIPEHTYYINVPNCYLDPNTQLPVYFNTFPGPVSEQNPTISILPDVLPSPDKFLIFPSSSSGTNPVISDVCTMSAVTNTVSTSPSTAAMNSIYSTFVPLVPKPEVKTTPPNSIIQNTKARSNSTPSRKASHIRILNFHTPAKQPALVAGTSARISTPGSAPPSVNTRPSRIPVVDLPRLDSILETSIKQEPRKTPEKISDDLDPAPLIPAFNPNSVSNTPRVSKDPRTCVRVLSESASDEPVEIAIPTVEIPASVVAETCKKTPTPRVQISDAEMEEWRRIRSVSKSNFDQHLRMMEEQRQKPIIRPQLRRKRKKPPTRKAPGAAASKEPSEEATPSKDDSLESLDKANTSLTEIHGQMLEDALASAKKPEAGKTPGKTPAKAKTPAKEDGNGGGEQGNKIYVKIATPRKKTPLKTTPKRKSAKKRRLSSPRKRVAVKKKEDKPKALEQKETVENSEEVKVEEKEPDVIVEKEPEPETPAKADDNSLSQVEATPPEAPKPIKDHPKLLAKKSSAEYVRKEQEKAAESASTAASLESPPEKPPAVAVDNSFGSSLCLETPFKADLSSIPITPRFLMPNQIENTPMVKIVREGMDTNSSLKKTCDIQTPNFPITPGLISTPKSINSVSPQSLSGTGGFSTRRTDYSSGSSYYKPDESEDLDKNLEAMLHGERKKRPVADTSEKESIEELPQPEVEPVIESTPQKSEHASASSSESSSSSDSSSDSSTSGSSPENTPVKQESSPVSPSPKKSSVPYLTAYEARRQQLAELEAKKQRTIARMKIAKPAPPMKKTDRKFSVPPGFKSRNVVITRGKEDASKPAVSTGTPPRAAASPSSKRKNPTPRKVVFLDKILPMSANKHSPKRKPLPSQDSSRKSPRASLLISEQEVHRIITPRKDKAIEGTYESEDLSRLCCTPDIPDVDPAADKKQVYEFHSPERGCEAEDSSKQQGTPDSNKENQSLEAVKNSDPPQAEEKEGEEDASESSDGDEDDAYNDCSLSSVCEKDYFWFAYNEKKSSVVRCERSSEIRLIKKCNVVLEDRKVCLQPVDSIFLFEQLPSPPPSSGTRSSLKKAKTSAGEKDPKPEVAVAVPPASTMKAKINVVSAVRNSAHPATSGRAAHLLAEKQKRQQEAAIATKKDKLDHPTDKVHTEVPQAESSGKASEEKLASPSPKMPIKLDMKKKQQQQQQQQSQEPSPAKPTAGNTEPVDPAPPPAPVEDADPQLQKNILEDDIDAVLTHLHGS
ncbi:titin homolog [Ochlerotatus camptorhynchus]|uniref:titin homolog n=1 Tax=Ochlerotatus camptorhynchus TaxID=644619 RepID=UPI0031D6DCF4